MVTAALIVTADDFGLSADTVNATAECLLAGSVTSASIMANMPATGPAIEFATTHPQFSYGIHFTFVGDGTEKSLSPPDTVPNLVDSAGRFYSTIEILRRAFLGSVSIQEIATEARAQVDHLIRNGVRLQFANAHGNVHKYAPFHKALAPILREYAIEASRAAQNIWLKRPIHSPGRWLARSFTRPVAESFVTTRNVFIPTCMYDRCNLDRLVSLSHLGSLELGVHPGFDQSWRDLERWATGRLFRQLRELNHRPIGWREFLDHPDTPRPNNTRVDVSRDSE